MYCRGSCRSPLLWAWVVLAGSTEVDRTGQPRSSAQRLLLLVRALGDVDSPTDLVNRVADALLAVGNAACPRELAVEAAQQLLEDRGGTWSMQGDVLVCDNEYAARRLGGLPPEDLLKVTRALQ